MRVLLDTATLIFAVESPEKIGKRAVVAMKNTNNALELSVVSLTEIAIKTSLGKLRFSAEMARRAIRDLDLRILPYTSEHAFRFFDLPLHHRDPFDRQIIAQALSEQVAVATPDEAFALYRGVKTVW
ncbi:MAG TPA: type II toxin-antitoxin system VapC family toxin [Terriglobales bacterium]|nr:type II toxin-antitoxin system VapC family toxin [Terriglobales bacterium]